MKYIKEFDSLRAFAVLGVMFSHYLGQFKHIGILGSSGVTLFFVLSGYLITQILFKEKDHFQIDATHNFNKVGTVLKIFYIRRSLRIFPIYYLTFFVLLVLNIDSARAYWPYHAFYASNFLYAFKIYFDHLSHFWSLAVEEQFYLVWPFLILLLPLKSNKILFFGSLVVLSALFRCFMASQYGVASPAVYYMMPSCMEAFAIGGMVIFLSKTAVKKSTVVMVCLLSFALFVALQILPIKIDSVAVKTVSSLFSYTVFSIFCGSIILMIVNDMLGGFLKAVLNNSALRLIGKISYGIYVYHMFVPGILEYVQKTFKFSLSGTGLNLPLHFILSFVIAYLSFILIEQPINKLKSKFAYK